MRRRELNIYKKKTINGEFSDFELQEFVEEVNGYTNLLNGLGFKIKKVRNKNEKINAKTIKTEINESNVKLEC
jgi:hypothetical protein